MNVSIRLTQKLAPFADLLRSFYLPATPGNVADYITLRDFARVAAIALYRRGKIQRALRYIATLENSFLRNVSYDVLSAQLDLLNYPGFSVAYNRAQKINRL